MRLLISDFVSTFRAVRADYELGRKLDPSVKSKSDILLFSASFHGLMLYRFSHFFWKNRMKFIAMSLRYLERVLYKMDIHPATEIEAGIFIDHGIGVVIGETASIGRGTLIYHGVTLGSAHVMSGKRHPSVGKDVIIGANASILGPVIIGDGAKIGANTVVLHDISPFSTVVGNPGHIVRKGDQKIEFDIFDRKNPDCEFENDGADLVETGKNKSGK